MANFFDQFDAPASGVDIGASGRPRVWITPDSGARPDQSPYAGAISKVESGGNYRAIGPETGKGRALGKYQVMDFNVGPWSQEVLGREVTPQEFISNPQIQDQIFNAKFGSYVDKYGPEGASRAWFAGEGGMDNPNRRDVLGTTVADYSRKFMGALGGGQAMAFAGQPTAAPQFPPQSAPSQAPQGANFFDQFDNPAPQAGPNIDQAISDVQQFQRPDMQAQMQRVAQDMTRGPEQSPMTQAATEAVNVLPAASQGTNPNVERYAGRLISAETFQDELGNIQYRDPQTGQLKTTDTSKEVAIRDPADGTVKIFSRSDDTNESAAVGVSRVLAPGLAAGAVSARPGLAAVSAAKTQPKASDIFATAKPFYRAFKSEAGKIEIPAETVAAIADRMRGALERANLIPELAQPVYSAVGILDKGKPITLDALQNVKRVIGRAFNSPDKNVRDAAAVASGEIGKIIGEVSKTASASLKTADAIHSTARSVQELQRKGAVAELRAGRAGYGGNAVNTMRQVLSPIVQRAVEGRMTGFKPDEIQAMRNIVEGTNATNSLRLVGQLSPTSGMGVIKSATAGGTAMAAGASGGMALAIPALGMASNKIATILTGRQIDRLRELVAKRSPAYAQGVAKAIERYNRAQAEFASNPAPNKFAAYLSSTRALSAGFQRDGIQITSGDLLRALQAPMKSAADDEQPSVPRSPGE